MYFTESYKNVIISRITNTNVEPFRMKTPIFGRRRRTGLVGFRGGDSTCAYSCCTRQLYTCCTGFLQNTWPHTVSPSKALVRCGLQQQTFSQ